MGLAGLHARAYASAIGDVSEFTPDMRLAGPRASQEAAEVSARTSSSATVDSATRLAAVLRRCATPKPLTLRTATRRPAIVSVRGTLRTRPSHTTSSPFTSAVSRCLERRGTTSASVAVVAKMHERRAIRSESPCPRTATSASSPARTELPRVLVARVFQSSCVARSARLMTDVGMRVRVISRIARSASRP